jgi:tetratricopeptide (TPR) repeat protein
MAWTLETLAGALNAQGMHLQAVEACADALRILRNLHFHEWSRQIRFIRREFRTNLLALGDDVVARALLEPRLAEIDAAIAQAPLDQQLRMQRAGLLFDFNRVDDAIASCSEVLERDPKSIAARCVRGDCHLQAGHFARAVDDFSVAIDATPDEWWFWRRRADAYQKLGEYEKSIADITKAGKLIENDWRQWICRSDSYRALGQWENAKQDYLKSFEVSGAWEARRALGRLYAEQGLWQEAAAELETTLAPPDDQRQVPVTLRQESPRIWSGLGLVNLARGDRAGYQRACARLAELAAGRSEPDILREAVWTCLVSPHCRLDPSQLLEIAERAWASGAGDADSQLVRRAAYYRAGQFRQAIQALTQAEAGDPVPTAAPAALYLAMAHAQLEQRQEAASYLTKARGVIEASQPPPDQGRSWSQNLVLRLLRQEAEALIGVVDDN